MPRGKHPTDGNDSYVMRDAFRRAAFNIGTEALKIDTMMKTKLWLSGTRPMPSSAYKDLRAAARQLGKARDAIERILAVAADREEET